jgi:sulfate adenylyltransferase subunit 1
LSFADEVVVDLFDKHKTLGELILIDRITNMTAACGVVSKLLESDHENYKSRLDRETRSLWKGQRAVTVEFPVGTAGITEEFVAKVEKELGNLGKHTYLYVPKAGEDVANVVKHLNDAGIVVLFVRTEDIDVHVFLENRTYYSNWIHGEELSVSDAVDYVSRVSSIYADVAVYGDYI